LSLSKKFASRENCHSARLISAQSFNIGGPRYKELLLETDPQFLLKKTGERFCLEKTLYIGPVFRYLLEVILPWDSLMPDRRGSNP
jgi:hypothetical protein